MQRPYRTTGVPPVANVFHVTIGIHFVAPHFWPVPPMFQGRRQCLRTRRWTLKSPTGSGPFPMLHLVHSSWTRTFRGSWSRRRPRPARRRRHQHARGCIHAYKPFRITSAVGHKHLHSRCDRFGVCRNGSGNGGDQSAPVQVSGCLKSTRIESGFGSSLC